MALAKSMRCIQNSHRSCAIDVGADNWVRPGCSNRRCRSEVVNLIWLAGLNRCLDRLETAEVTIMDNHLGNEFEKIAEARITRLDESVHLGAFSSEQLRKVATVLTGYPSDQGAPLVHFLCFIFCSTKSDSTIISTSCSNSTRGFHPSFSRALVGSAISRSTSAGRMNWASCLT